MLLQTILVGQPELRATLASPGMRQFAQRVLTDYHIGRMQANETQAYMRHRLTVAGGSPDLFTTDATLRLHEAAAGTPRLVNILCDTALVYGFVDQVQIIDIDTVSQVLKDRSGSILPLVPAAVAAASTVAG